MSVYMWCLVDIGIDKKNVKNSYRGRIGREREREEEEEENKKKDCQKHKVS